MRETFRLAGELFGNEPWGYISNRANSYSLQPVVYVHIRELQHNLVGYINGLPSHKGNQLYVDTEKMLVDEQFDYAVFNQVDDARAWRNASEKQGLVDISPDK